MARSIFGFTLAAVMLAGSVVACSSDEADPAAEVDRAGDVRLPLETTAPSGNVYRLRQAQFQIAGPENLLVAPPDDSSPAFTTELDAGTYSIELLPGWALWRMAPSEMQVEAELLSPNPVVASVLADSETNVTFQFRAGTEVVVFGPGELTVDISVVEAACGDGILETGEACDDGNTTGNDGCSADCSNIEPNWACPIPGQPCALCGDGVVDPEEACDDGNNVSGDGCNASCTAVEPGFVCPIPGQLCTQCGDGVVQVQAGEECDDGNTVSGDGCSSVCTIE